MNEETLRRYEPTLAKLFQNSRKKDRVAGAYLLYGPKNAPLKEVALYLAESFGCEKGLFACHECPSCRRFEEGIHPDFLLIDGETQMIKRADIDNLEEKLSKTTLEKRHRPCYVIHRIENTNTTSCNALLKFLEEPKDGRVAILTSYHRDRVLPTILSRCIAIRIDPIDPKAFRDELLSTTFQKEGGRKKYTLDEGGAYILSRLYSSLDEVQELLFQDKAPFQTGYGIAEEFLQTLPLSSRQAAFSLLRNNEVNRDNKCYNWLYLTLNDVFTTALLGEDISENPFREVILKLREHPAATEAAEDIIKEALANRQLNYTPTLVSAKILLALEEV